MIMKAAGAVSDFTYSKQRQIAAAIVGVLAGHKISVSLSKIKIIVEAASRRLNVGRALSAGVTITAEITAPSSSSVAEVSSTLASGASAEALKTTLKAVGIEITEVTVEGTDGSCDGGCIAGIVIGVLLVVALIVVIIVMRKRKAVQSHAQGVTMSKSQSPA